MAVFDEEARLAYCLLADVVAGRVSPEVTIREEQGVVTINDVEGRTITIGDDGSVNWESLLIQAGRVEMDVVKNESGDFIVPTKTVMDFEFWKGLSEYARETESGIAAAYARTWGEEGQIALRKVAEELFGVDVDFHTRCVEGPSSPTPG